MIIPGVAWGTSPSAPQNLGAGLNRGATGKDPPPRPPQEPPSEKEVLFNGHCVGRGNTGSLELSQPPAFRLFGFVCFFGPFFFFLFLRANCSH